MVEHPDVIKTLYPVGLCACGADLKEQAATLKERRQQIDIPEPKDIDIKSSAVELRNYTLAFVSFLILHFHLLLQL
jgi:hypothetical protein